MDNSRTRFVRNDATTTSQVIDGEAIIIKLNDGAYYSLPDVGAEVWELLASSPRLDELVECVVARYEVGPEQARPHLVALLGQLAAEGLVTLSETATPSPVSPGAPSSAMRRAYRVPALECYRDMAELLALDPPTPGVLDHLLRRPENPQAAEAPQGADGSDGRPR